MNTTKPPPRAQTIKQAKASYKARGRPSLSEGDKKRLEREIELDRRAWRAKESEKRRAEALKKRQEKEQEERERQAQLRMGTQRRCDRFGYKSSQMHLGAFLRKPGPEADRQKDNVAVVAKMELEDDFGDSDMDDETLLNALDGAGDIRARPGYLQSAPVAPIRQPDGTVSLLSSKTLPPIPFKDDFESFLNELDSSTQIARELATEQPYGDNDRRKSAGSSFESDFLDITDEDLAALEKPKARNSKLVEDRKLMPPPALPVKRPASAVPIDIGYTMSELEQYVDDDLQLTQADPP